MSDAAQKYRHSWDKKNMKIVSASYKAEFVDRYKEALKKLDLRNSDVIRKMMEDVIKQAEGK